MSTQELGTASTLAVDPAPSSTKTRTREARRDVYQDRLKTYFRFLFLIGLFIHVTFSALALIGGAPWTFVVFHFAWLIIGGLGVAWWWLAAAERSPAGLRAVDVVVNVTITTLLATIPLGWNEGEAADVSVAGMTIEGVLLCVLVRSAFVPSSLRYNVAITLAMTVPTAVMIVAIPIARPWLVSGLRGVPFELGWFAVFVAASVYLSHVIWGLRERVRAAEQLGQYQLVEKLGEGGMGVVYRASHAMLRRDTAVKLLKPEHSGEQSIRRFEREVQMTARLTHPNTVEIYDYGRTPDGVFYYAMELLDGIDLSALVKRDGPLPAPRVVHVLEQICGALAEAHAVGLVHRDIKPANIILCCRGGIPDVAKIVDFGLVKRTRTPAGGEDDASLTGLNEIVGTPQYMAPEAIARPDAEDARSDIYALGATAFYMLTGEPLFHAKTVVEICGHHLHTPPDPPSARVEGGVGEDLDEVILRCLDKNPDERWASAAELGEALAGCRAAGAWSARDAGAWWEQFERTRDAPSDAPPSDRSLVVDFRRR